MNRSREAELLLERPLSPEQQFHHTRTYQLLNHGGNAEDKIKYFGVNPDAETAQKVLDKAKSFGDLGCLGFDQGLAAVQILLGKKEPKVIRTDWCDENGNPYRNSDGDLSQIQLADPFTYGINNARQNRQGHLVQTQEITKGFNPSESACAGFLYGLKVVEHSMPAIGKIDLKLGAEPSVMASYNDGIRERVLLGQLATQSSELSLNPRYMHRSLVEGDHDSSNKTYKMESLFPGNTSALAYFVVLDAVTADNAYNLVA